MPKPRTWHRDGDDVMSRVLHLPDPDSDGRRLTRCHRRLGRPVRLDSLTQRCDYCVSEFDEEQREKATGPVVMERR